MIVIMKSIHLIVINICIIITYLTIKINSEDDVPFSYNNYKIINWPSKSDLLSLNTEQFIKKQSSICKFGQCYSYQECLPFIQHYHNTSIESCTLGDGSSGLCCTMHDRSKIDVPIRPPIYEDEPMNRNENELMRSSVTQNDIDTAGRAALNYVRGLEDIEEEIQRQGLVAKSGTEEYAHSHFFGSSLEVNKLNREATVTLYTSCELSKSHNIDFSRSTRSSYYNVNMRDSVVRNCCPKEPPCRESKYRTIDGSCNNIENPSWGKSMTPSVRILPAAYGDGRDTPRVASNGSPLPNAREISFTIGADANIVNRKYSLSFMVFGQFLDHDISRGSITKTKDNGEIICCDERIRQNPRLLHPACMVIDIPRNDPFYRRFGQTCMSFVRSAPVTRPSCEIGPREQMNQLTAYIDGSIIYGSTNEEAVPLRAFSGGRLKSQFIDGRELLPIREKGSCNIPRETGHKCFDAGDVRVNEQVELTVLQTVFLREHNRIVKELNKLNRGWNDETLFQETRRIVGAQFQHIVYNEFLPILIGVDTMARFGLSLTRNGYSRDYNKNINAGIVSGFSTAAYRLHGLIEGIIDLVKEDNSVLGRLNLHTQFNNPELLYRMGSVDLFIGGVTGQPVRNADNVFTREITNNLFRQPGKPFGFDLLAFNIQRGRDHGIPPYNAWRRACGLKRFRTFEELNEAIDSKAVAHFTRLYKSVEDIDLYVAGVAEKPLPDAMVGPTFACIIAEQFRKLKVGDRFWYENGGFRSSFSLEQLNEIRKTSLARILCDNGDNLNFMQPNAMIQQFQWNSKVYCKGNDIRRMDLNFWRNEPI